MGCGTSTAMEPPSITPRAGGSPRSPASAQRASSMSPIGTSSVSSIPGATRRPQREPNARSTVRVSSFPQQANSTANPTALSADAFGSPLLFQSSNNNNSNSGNVAVPDGVVNPFAARVREGGSTSRIRSPTTTTVALPRVKLIASATQEQLEQHRLANALCGLNFASVAPSDNVAGKNGIASVTTSGAHDSTLVPPLPYRAAACARESPDGMDNGGATWEPTTPSTQAVGIGTARRDRDPSEVTEVFHESPVLSHKGSAPPIRPMTLDGGSSAAFSRHSTSSSGHLGTPVRPPSPRDQTFTAAFDSVSVTSSEIT